MEMKAITRCLRICCMTCLVALGLAASEHHGVVKFGTVPVPGATVTATKGDSKLVAITDEGGFYSFAELADGVWKLQIDMLTFAPLNKEIGIAPGAPGAEWALTMLSMDQIKPNAQTSAPPTATPSTSAVTTTPVAGAAPAAASASGAPATPSIVAANGGAPAKDAKPPAKGGKTNGKTPATPTPAFQRTEVNASADGAAASTPPSSSIAADSSQTADALVVNGSNSNGIERRAIGNTRRGPRSLYNGNFALTFDNSILNARGYSLSGQETARAPYNHLTGSASVGGPLWIPHLFRWTGNFTANYAVTRNRNATITTATMPTDAERAGNFSALNTPILDPTTGQPFPNGVIPAARLALVPEAQYLLKFYPHPQFSASGLSYNYQTPVIGRNDMDAVQVRVGKPINNRSNLQMLFAYQNIRNQNNNVFNFLDTSKTSNYRGTVNYSRSIGRMARGTFGVEFSRSAVNSVPYFVALGQNVSKDAGITGNDQSPSDFGPPSLNFSSGIYPLSDGNPSLNRNQSLGLTGNITYVRRPHNFQFGGEARFNQISTVGQQNGRGSFGFNGKTTGFDFADFLLGIPGTSQLAFGNADKYLRSRSYALFVNDDWRVSPALTLNWGLRWEYGTPITELYGRLVNLDIASGFGAVSPVIAYNPTGALTGAGYGNALVHPDHGAIQPRISFAWKPIFGASTVVRGSYGVYYNTSSYNQIASRMLQQAPLSKSLSVQNSPTNPLTLRNGFLSPANVTQNTFAVDPHYQVGYSQNWTVSVQQNVTASMVLTGSYLGIKGTRLPQAFRPNTYADGINPCSFCAAGYEFLTSNGNSTKHSGQLLLRRRFHGGFQTNATYTYSKAIDDTAPGSGIPTAAQNWRNLAGERGLSSFDQRHLLEMSFQYSTGVGVRGGALLSGWRGLIIKGWTLTSNVRYGSGLPINLVYAVPSNGNVTSPPLRPQYLGGDIYAGTDGRFLNPAAFGPPLPGQFGNAARNLIIGPNQFTMVGTMARSFKDNITLRIDSQNVLNHPTFNSWNAVYSPGLANGGSFGLRNPPAAMRTVQAQLRWSF